MQSASRQIAHKDIVAILQNITAQVYCSYSQHYHFLSFQTCQKAPICSIISFLAPPAPLIFQLHHSNIVPLRLRPLLSLRSIEHNDDPKHPDASRNETVCYNDALALSSQRETEKTVNQPGGDEKAAEPDVDVRVWSRGLVALILEVMDVAQDGLEDEEDDDCYAEDGVKGGELGSMVSTGSGGQSAGPYARQLRPCWRYTPQVQAQ